MDRMRVAFPNILGSSSFDTGLPLTAAVRSMHAADSGALKVGQGSLLPVSANVGWSSEK